ncbi:uncharacterized protein N7500_001828 [Penicillium coprophilum]|uniref:uncharacterized protein n=1 Tax=Penicillium coprophilum TaxID=36646 RepID=UPI00238C0C47|nr:uncharacterized protein N7500_001828 [Penicillium coprophilum]KAJ5173897.1 hypothetical protein N7500_001828 [Penicillium coprophilum]
MCLRHYTTQDLKHRSRKPFHCAYQYLLGSRPQIEAIAAKDKLIQSISGEASDAGGFETQYQIEHGLHLELARAANRSGSRISSSTAGFNRHRANP